MSADLLRAAAQAMRIDASALDEDRAWYPAVALAVADWLDTEADECAQWEHKANSPLERLAIEDGHRCALAVARAYLGTT